MKNYFILIRFLIIIIPCVIQSQITLDANLDLDLTHAQQRSNYYYNEVNEERIGWSAGLSEVRVYVGLDIGNLTLHVQPSLTRKRGAKEMKFQFEQLNINQTFTDGKIDISLGRVMSPFGSFYNRQFSHHRWFLSAPLHYSYYNNVSPSFGYQSELGENGFIYNGDRDWGSSTNYRYGYLTGLKLALKPTENFEISTAFGNRSSISDLFGRPSIWEWILRATMKVGWNYTHSISLRHHQFRPFEAAEIGLTDKSSLDQFTQFQIGYDFEYGSSIFEIRGEIISTHYSVPNLDLTNGYDLSSGALENESLSSFSSYLDLRIEPPILSGISISYRPEALIFNTLDDVNWDNNVFRHSVVLGYKLSQNALARVQYTFQDVKNKRWDQNVFRMALTFHL